MEDIGSHGQNYEYFPGQPSLIEDLDPFYDEVPPGGEFVVQSGDAFPPAPLRESPEEAAARRKGTSQAFRKILDSERD